MPSLFKQRHPMLYIEKAKVKFFINYHLYNFYINVTGILDNLAWLLSYFYELGFKEENRKSRLKCTLRNEKFLSNLETKNGEIVSYIRSDDTKEWLEDVYPKRDISAHREIIILTEIFIKQESSTRIMADMGI